jgi:hypothetical protein
VVVEQRSEPCSMVLTRQQRLLKVWTPASQLLASQVLPGFTTLSTPLLNLSASSAMSITPDTYKRGIGDDLPSTFVPVGM